MNNFPDTLTLCSKNTLRTYRDIQQVAQYQEVRSSVIPPRTTFMEPPIFGSSTGDPTLCTYTEAMINDGQAHYAYSDTNEHIIRVSNTISVINVRGNNAGTDDYQIIEYNSGNGITEIGPSCFMNCKSLEKVTIQDNINVIGQECFKNCSKLSSINMEGKVFQYIGDESFYNSNIKNMIFNFYLNNETLSSDGKFYMNSYFGRNIFGSCSYLNSISIDIYSPFNNPITENCNNLTSCTFLHSEKLGSSLFKKCENLSCIRFCDYLTNVDSFDKNVFSECSATKIIFEGFTYEYLSSRIFEIVSVDNINIPSSEEISKDGLKYGQIYTNSMSKDDKSNITKVFQQALDSKIPILLANYYNVTGCKDTGCPYTSSPPIQQFLYNSLIESLPCISFVIQNERVDKKLPGGCYSGDVVYKSLGSILIGNQERLTDMTIDWACTSRTTLRAIRFDGERYYGIGILTIEGDDLKKLNENGEIILKNVDFEGKSIDINEETQIKIVKIGNDVKFYYYNDTRREWTFIDDQKPHSFHITDKVFQIIRPAISLEMDVKWGDGKIQYVYYKKDGTKIGPFQDNNIFDDEILKCVVYDILKVKDKSEQQYKYKLNYKYNSFFGMYHDCEIWTCDHIISKWDEQSGTLTKTGTW